MGVFLDIDADFIFEPRTSGNCLVKQRPWISPGRLRATLRRSGLSWAGAETFIFTDHKEAYFVWKERRVSHSTLIHVDTHSDMYDSFPWVVHCGNFLRKALDERVFSRVVWVMPGWLYDSGDWEKFDLPGARRNKGDCRDHSRRQVPTVLIWDKKIPVEAVPLDAFVMPNTRVQLLTIATSPSFVPFRSEVVRQFVEKMAGTERDKSASRASDSLARSGPGVPCKVTVRPNIPLCLEHPVLKRLLEEAGGEDLSGRKGFGYLWAEHRIIQERETTPWQVTA
ncbi:MAG: hypothetical protein IMF26_01820 [Candidatus Fermentithermobacillus carboniphilus]|uniref:Uncharacterized protein n=1 Tax=Candidatus Fermentithermobacillus carboniphilus TaxID=3085328 RepID=A0AAT9LCP8_9FIRM|nr:MAG: hypothetical protein IMF26_01820 [Candidatus Fermentithermobacillus carboniphilus]